MSLFFCGGVIQISATSTHLHFRTTASQVEIVKRQNCSSLTQSPKYAPGMDSVWCPVGHVGTEGVLFVYRKWSTGSTLSERPGSTTYRWPSLGQATRRWRKLIQSQDRLWSLLSGKQLWQLGFTLPLSLTAGAQTDPKLHEGRLYGENGSKGLCCGSALRFLLEIKHEPVSPLDLSHSMVAREFSALTLENALMDTTTLQCCHLV